MNTNKMKTITNKIKGILHENIYNNFIYTQRLKYNKIYKKRKITHIKKLKTLLQRQRVTVDDNFERIHSRWCINLTNIDLPENVKEILSLGWKFNLPITMKSFTTLDLVVDFEYCIHESIKDDFISHFVRNKFLHLVYQHIDKLKYSNISNNYLLKSYFITKRFFKEDNNLLICKADKGNATVTISQDHYANKMEELLSDQITYKHLNKDPSNNIIKNLKSLLSTLVQTNILTRRIKNLD